MNKIRSITVTAVDGKTVTLNGDEFELVLKGSWYGLQNTAISKLMGMLFGATQGEDHQQVAKAACRTAAAGG